MSISHTELYTAPVTASAVAMLRPGTISGTKGPSACIASANEVKASLRWVSSVAAAAPAAMPAISGLASAAHPARSPTFRPGANGRKFAESA